MRNNITIETTEERKRFNKTLLSMTIPIAFQSFMAAAVSTSDAVMLGFLNQDSLSAVSLAGQITFVLNLFIIVLTQGTTLLAAQYWGKGDRKTVEMVLGLAMKLALIITVVFFAATLLFPRPLMRIFTSDPELISRGSEYLRIAGLSYIFTAINQLYLCIMRNSGKTTKSTIIGSSAMVLNIILNMVFIFGAFGIPAMGISGAALATVLATLCQTIGVIVESKKPDSIKIKMAYLIRIDEQLQKDFIKYTMPIVGNYMFYGLGVTMYSVIMGHLGSDAVAANSLANIVMNLITCVGKGVGMAGAILVGNELGKNEMEKAKLYAGRSTVVSAICGVGSGALLLLLRPVILSFANLSTDAAGYLSGMLLICCYYVIPSAINSAVIGGIFCAGGKSRFGLICDAIVLWLVILPLGFLAAFYLQLPVIAVFFILRLDECIKVPVVYLYYRRYTWANNLTRQVSRKQTARRKPFVNKNIL